MGDAGVFSFFVFVFFLCFPVFFPRSFFVSVFSFIVRFSSTLGNVQTTLCSLIWDIILTMALHLLFLVLSLPALLTSHHYISRQRRLVLSGIRSAAPHRPSGKSLGRSPTRLSREDLERSFCTGVVCKLCGPRGGIIVCITALYLARFLSENRRANQASAMLYVRGERQLVTRPRWVMAAAGLVYRDDTNTTCLTASRLKARLLLYTVFCPIWLIPPGLTKHRS